MRQIAGLFLVLILLLTHTASALTNSSATITWNKTSDATIRYEIRWKHFANNWQWESVATDLDSTLGVYQHRFGPLADSTGDRGACWDLRSKKGVLYSAWLSATNQQVCNQIPLAAAPTPVPVPVPPPAPTGLVITSATPLEIVITASSADCPRITTSTKGSTALQPKRTVTCVK